MYTPTRTALYLALCATVFAANEANAGCKLVGGSLMCASWIKGSEVCQVTIDETVYGPPVSVECSITGADVTYPDGPGSPSVCPTGELPPGDLTCDDPPGSSSYGPPTIPDGPIGANPWRIFGANSVPGTNGVTMNGGSSASGIVGSNANITIAGTNTRIYGDAHAVGTVFTNTGASVTGITDNVMPTQAVGTPPAACSPFTGPDDMYLGPGASLVDGNLTVSGGGTAALYPDWLAPYWGFGPYCFNKITLNGGSALEFQDATTISMKGALSVTGGSKLANTTSYASLTINSSVSTANGVTLNGSRGNNVTINAPGTDIKIGIGANYLGSFIGKSVTLSGAASVNNPDPAVIYYGGSPVSSLSATDTTVDCNGTTCTASAEIGPPDGSTCGPSGGAAVDFTADQFIATVKATFLDEEYESTFDVTLHQWCTLNGSTYSCTDLYDPYAMCDGGEGSGSA